MNLLKTDKKAALKKRSEKAFGIFNETISELSEINKELSQEIEAGEMEAQRIINEAESKVDKIKAQEGEMLMQQEQNSKLVNKLIEFTQF